MPNPKVESLRKQAEDLFSRARRCNDEAARLESYDRVVAPLADEFRKDVENEAAAGIGVEEKIAFGNTAWIEDLFTYHSPDPIQRQQLEAVRMAAKHFAEVLVKNTPISADQETAIRKLRECVMTANASIALRGRA